MKLLCENDIKEQLSIAYVHALASKLGLNVEKTGLDRDSVDLTVKGGGSGRPAIAIQLKATSSPNWNDENLHFTLKRKNYNDLVAKRQTPAILVVLELPKDSEERLVCNIGSLTLKKAAWWVSICGQDPLEEQDSKTIHIPKAQVFDEQGLLDLMELSRSGSI